MSWDELHQAIAEARSAIAAQAPDPAVAAEGEAYVARVLAAGLGGSVLGHLFQQDGLSRALPCYGGPNPDYIMRFAPVDANGHYRLDGRLNGSERVGVGLYSYGPNGAPLAAGYVAFDPANCAADGSFAIDLDGGEGGGAGLRIQPGTRVMLVRVLHRDPGSEPASLRFTGGAPQQGDDVRVQPELVRAAKRAGRLRPDWSVPDRCSGRTSPARCGSSAMRSTFTRSRSVSASNGM